MNVRSYFVRYRSNNGRTLLGGVMSPYTPCDCKRFRQSRKQQRSEVRS